MRRTALFCAVAGCVFLADLASMAGLSEGRWTHPQHALERATDQTPPPGGRSSASTAVSKHVRTGGLRRDSIRRNVEAGDVLIMTLPAQLAGRAVSAYEMIRTPALSDLAGRSFFWRTRRRDEGRHRLLFQPQRADSAAAAPDTLALLVTVE